MRREVMGVGGVCVCRGSCLRRNDGGRWGLGVGGVVGERGALDSSRGIGMGRRGGGHGFVSLTGWMGNS